MQHIILSLILLIISLPSFATYDANISRVIKHVAVYVDGDYIYFSLENPPEHPKCKNSLFVIEKSVPYERRQMLLSRLLFAYASKESINIGYDKTGNCVSGYIRVHRVG